MNYSDRICKFIHVASNTFSTLLTQFSLFIVSTLLDVTSWNLHEKTYFCAIWLEFSLEEVENKDKLVLMVFYILWHDGFFQIIFNFILYWDCLYLNHIQDGFTLCLMQNVHLSLSPPLSFCDWLTSSSEFSHWSFPSLSFNYWFHFGGHRGFWGKKLSNLWKKLNFNIKLNDFLESMNSLKFLIFSSKSSPFLLHWWLKWSY